MTPWQTGDRLSVGILITHSAAELKEVSNTHFGVRQCLGRQRRHSVPELCIIHKLQITGVNDSMADRRQAACGQSDYTFSYCVKEGQ